MQLEIILTFLIFGMVACGQPQVKSKHTPDLQKSIGTGKLIPINLSDTNYVDVQFYANDTITADGWTIQYLVKDDSTKYNDIYIKSTKGNKTATFFGGEILLMRRYFIPKFVGETKSHLFFEHGCATDCSAILVLSKSDLPKYKDYQNVVDYNLPLGQILYVTDKCYENEDKIYDLALVDLNRNKEHSITFENICGAVSKPTCIDTVIFTDRNVTIKTTLRERIDSEKEIIQTKTIEL